MCITECSCVPLPLMQEVGGIPTFQLFFLTLNSLIWNWSSDCYVRLIIVCMILCCRYRLSGGGGSSSEEDEAYDKRERDLFGAKTNTSEQYYYMSMVTQWSIVYWQLILQIYCDHNHCITLVLKWVSSCSQFYIYVEKMNTIEPGPMNKGYTINKGHSLRLQMILVYVLTCEG